MLGPHGPVGPTFQKFSDSPSAWIRSRGTPTSTQRSTASSSAGTPSIPSNTVIQMRSGSSPSTSVENSHPNRIASSLK